MVRVSGRINVVSPEPGPAGATPPASPEAEQSVLGAILLRPQVMDLVADTLSPPDFYREAPRRVHDKAVLRRLLSCSQEIAGACLSPVEDVGEFLDWAEHQVFSVAEAKIRQGFLPIEGLVNQEIATLEAIWGRKDDAITGVRSGFKDLDNYTAGFQPSDLIIIAARPSMGKTALALNVAFNAAYDKPQTPVAFFSLAMFKKQLLRRFLSSEGTVDASQIRRAAFLTHQEWANLQEAAGKLLDCQIYIDDTPAATVLEIWQ